MTAAALNIPYARQSIDEYDCAAVQEALKSGFITRGPQVKAFEEALASRVQAKFAICFSNASAALWAACQAIDLKPQDEAFVPTNTFMATASCAMVRLAKLILVDVDPQHGSMNLATLQSLVQEPLYHGRRVFLPVHFAGVAMDMQKLSSMAAHQDIIIEDAAHAIGSYYPTGEPVGSCAYSDMTIFSFHATKNITCGEGGAVTTQSEELAQKLRQIRDSGIVRGDALEPLKRKPGYYEVNRVCCNTHMNELQAALGLSQLKKLDTFGSKRQELIEAYRHHLDPSLSIITGPLSPKSYYHLCVALIDFENFQVERTSVMEYLASKGIGTQVHYVPLYCHPAIQNYSGWRNRDLQQLAASQDYYSQTLSLPLYYDLRLDAVRGIVDNLHQALANAPRRAKT